MPMLRQVRFQRRGRELYDITRGDNELAAIQERAPDLKRGGVKAGIGGEGDGVFGRELREVAIHHEADDRAMGDDDAFRACLWSRR